MKNKKGFTLIELLAVIIILGILMVIAVPAVTKYINDSRKNGYVSTAKNLAGGVRNLINSGSLDLDDPDTTYYIDGECIKEEGAYKSPYGDFDRAYVVVTADYNGHEYYWTSVDDTGIGVKSIISIDNLDSDNVEEGITSNDITTNRGLDNRSKIVVVDSTCQKGEPTDRTGAKIDSLTGKEIKALVCNKAITLHTATCEKTSGGCAATIGNGNTITYGTIPNGAPEVGNAYDCDVNNDGTYDSTTERFYYVGSNGANSILIYYKNINDQTTYAYDSSGENWHGPRTAYQYLPSTTTWGNSELILPGTRQIVNELGATSTSGGTTENFTYEGKAARFITYQEIVVACGNSSNMSSTQYIDGYIDNCRWLMENIADYEKDNGISSHGYWFETPISFMSNYTWGVYGSLRGLYSADGATTYGVRPVITVKTSDIE